MKDKVVTLDGGLEYYIVEELVEDKRRYCLAIQISKELEEVYDNYIICEIINKDGKIMLDDIYDINKKEKISNMLLDKIESLKED